MHSFGISLHCRSVSGNDAPSDAPAGNQIILRHASESDAGNVGRHGGEGDVRRFVFFRIVIENELVVNFIRENNEVVAARYLGNLLQQSAACTANP